MGTALRYANGQWEALGVRLDDERVPLDHNGSERALRRVALGRKNFSSSSTTPTPARTSAVCIRSWRRARRGASTRSSTAPTSSPASKNTRPETSTPCCQAPGPPPTEQLAQGARALTTPWAARLLPEQRRRLLSVRSDRGQAYGRQITTAIRIHVISRIRRARRTSTSREATPLCLAGRRSSATS
ncbi:MAG: transposase [Deltaproteobacteria bacterium]|nr:transposase [Deltaproteobacteria bacterium]